MVPQVEASLEDAPLEVRQEDWSQVETQQEALRPEAALLVARSQEAVLPGDWPQGEARREAIRQEAAPQVAARREAVLQAETRPAEAQPAEAQPAEARVVELQQGAEAALEERPAEARARHRSESTRSM